MSEAVGPYAVEERIVGGEFGEDDDGLGFAARVPI
jgi:hypothetical protein